MSQWLSVIIAGLVGGGVIALLKGSSGPWPAFLEDKIAKLEKEHPLWALFIHLPRNALFGTVASFVVWALGTVGADLDAKGLPAAQWATFIIVGMGGGYTISALYERAQKAEISGKVAANLATTLETLARLPPVANPSPGTGPGPGAAPPI